jgi:glycosyltransferase involved in cell wall biosynthesis
MNVYDRPDLKPKKLTLIWPVTDCEYISEDFFSSLMTLLNKNEIDFELIGINISVDNATGQKLSDLRKKIPDLSLFQYSKNPGFSSIYNFGFSKAAGEKIIILDNELDHDPNIILEIFEILNHGYDYVAGWRNPNHDSTANKFQTWLFNFFSRKILGSPIHDLNCGVRGLTKKVGTELNLYGDSYRFMPFWAASKGFRVTELRFSAKSKKKRFLFLNPRVYFQRMIDLFTLFFLHRFTQQPLRFFGLIGALFGVTGVILFCYLFIIRIMGHPIGHRPLLLLGAVFLVFGVQIFSLGLLGELIIYTGFRDLEENKIEQILE